MEQKPFIKYASVILDLSLDKALDYGITEEHVNKIQRGVRVEIPVRGHMRSGFVVDVKNSSDFKRVLPISKVLSDTELITPDLFELSLWMAKYYCTPLREVIKTLIPSSIRKETKPKEQFFVMRSKTRDELVEICEKLRLTNPAQAAILDVMLKVKKGILLSELLEQAKVSRSPVDTLVKKGFLILDILRIDRSPLINEQYFQTKQKQLNEDQAQALERIVHTIEHNAFETHLLHGVTGSGKTEVYLQAIDAALKVDKGTIMLVPEISLTPQTIERFRSRFEGKIAILHYRLSHGERSDEWYKIFRGDAKIVIGARSAVFSPVKNLGLIIVDEEHDQSYKQSESAPAYHARDVAVMRAKICKSAIILGSATPCLESYYNALNNKYQLSKLPSRADIATIPKVTIVDMQREFEKRKAITSFSDLLLSGIEKRQKVGEQTILFLNRRGYHTTLFCTQCREAIHCIHCDAALTFHMGDNCLSCHLCGFTMSPPPKECPKCHAQQPMKYRGAGTELVQKALHAIFPEIRTIRIDADTTRHKGNHQRLFRDFKTGKADVLIGTQMVAKGLHFPEVTLVGILNADTNLNIPDFRASETAFQLITQVAGRSGRGAIPGEVIIQSSMPENGTIQLAAAQDYEKFYDDEIAVRQLFHYPPFTQMGKISFSGTNETQVKHVAESFRQQLIETLSKDNQIHPVIPAGHVKVKNRFRYQFLIRGPNVYAFNRAIESAKQVVIIPGSVRMFIDINPTSTFF